MPMIIKKYRAAVYTLGCRVNQYESRAMLEALSSAGLTVAPPDESVAFADLYIINTCAVTSESERKSRRLVRRCLKRNPNALIAVAGCASQLSTDEFAEIEGVSVIVGSRGKEEAVKAALALLESGERPSSPLILRDTLDFSRCAFNSIAETDPGVRLRTRAYIKIEDGCAANCAYCIIPTVRGAVSLRPEGDIIDEIKRVSASGCKEVVLTGIETSAYTNLSELIERVAEVDGIERIRLGSMDPSFLKAAFIDRIASVDKFMPHFHLSLQSGSSRTLAAMRRRYTAEAAAERVGYIREKIPRVMLSADIICGFPGETDEDFAETLKNIESMRLLHAHIFTYSRRPGTVADKMDGQISEQVKDARSAALSDMQRRIKAGLLDETIARGEDLPVLIETCRDGIAHGHTDSFIEAELPFEGAGRSEIVSVRPHSHNGDILLCGEASHT